MCCIINTRKKKKNKLKKSNDQWKVFEISVNKIMSSYNDSDCDCDDDGDSKKAEERESQNFELHILN